MTDPTHTSALTAAILAGRHAASFGFDWQEPRDALDKVREELAELEAALDYGTDAEVREELGDLYFAVSNVARKLAIDPEAALHEATRKFEQRFNALLAAVQDSGREPRELSLEELEQVWVRLKRVG